MLDARPPRQFAATVAELGDGLFRIETCGDAVNLRLAVRGGASTDLEPWRRRWTALLDRLLPVRVEAGG